MRSPALIAVVSALLPAGFACASTTSVFYTVDQAGWTAYSISQGATISSESFSTVGDGYYASEAGALGTIDGTRVTTFYDFLFDNGLLTDADGKVLTTKPDWTQAYTNDYLPAG